MSWQTYVDDHLMYDIEGNHLTSAAILGHDGSVWAQSASFPKVGAMAHGKIDIKDYADDFISTQVVKVDSSQVDESKGRKRKHLNDQVGAQSMEMLKVRAAPEEKLRQKGIFGSIASKGDKVQKRRLVNGQLETLDDFDDDTTALEGGTPGMSKGQATSLRSSKLSQLVTPRVNKPKGQNGFLLCYLLQVKMVMMIIIR